MKSEATIWTGLALLALSFGAMVAFGLSGLANVLVAVFGIVLFAAVGSTMSRPVDAAWLRKWVVIGFIVKLAGAVSRYYAATVFYGGVADAALYYRFGAQFAASWRAGVIPPLSGSRGFGTQVTEWITGVLFALLTPDLLGGFLMFSLIAFFGQLLLYAAFRHWARPHQLKPYALLLFLLPTYSFWPSSIGKDALILLGLGAAAYAIARALKAFQVRWLLLLGVGLAGLGVIRLHVAGLVVVGLVAAAIVSKVRPDAAGGAGWRRILVLAGAAGAAVVVLSLAPAVLGIDLSDPEALNDFAADVTDNTSQGTVASGQPVDGPEDIPAALALVLFRPFLFEASQVQHLFAAAETTFLLALTVWKLPAVIRNLRKWRSNGYVVFCTFYTLIFAVAFSVVRNLGIIARQRGQVLAFFLAALVILGWERRPRARRTVRPVSPVQEVGR